MIVSALHVPHYHNANSPDYIKYTVISQTVTVISQTVP